MKRIITVFATQGKQKVKFDTDVSTWSGLKTLVEAEGFDLKKLSATESINRTNLEHKDAVLPESAFTLYLRPKKTKSGQDVSNMGHRDMKKLVNNDEMKAFITGRLNGKNWTQAKTEELRSGLTAWFSQDTPGKNVIVEEVTEEFVEEVREDSPKEEAIVVDTLAPLTDYTQDVIAFLESYETSDEKGAKRLQKAAKFLREETGTFVISEEDKIAAEKKEAKRLAKEEDRLETERLEQEARDLDGGF